MNMEFVAYLKAIGMTDILKQRVETIYDFYRKVCPEEIIDIFVTDFLNGDGGREYENLWFFSQSYTMEAKRFVSRDNFDMTPIRERIIYWSVEKQDYDFEKSTDKSKLHIQVNIDVDQIGDLKASKENCDYLKVIFQKYILSNLKH
jgi:hypothetical protein